MRGAGEGDKCSYVIVRHRQNTCSCFLWSVHCTGTETVKPRAQAAIHPLLLPLHGPVSDNYSTCVGSMLGSVFIFSAVPLPFMSTKAGYMRKSLSRFCNHHHQVSILTNINSGSNTGFSTCVNIHA